MSSPYPHFFLQYRDRIERPATWRGRRYWVLSRPLCAFRLFRLPDAERGRLKDFVALKVREWAPYSELGFHLHLTQDTARVWAWDGARVRDGMSTMGINAGRLAVRPEGALQARAADGLRLVNCLEGIEGQFWLKGELQASRWWPETPSRAEWLNFQRASGVVVDSAADPPPAEDPVWRARPWTNSGPGSALGVERHGRQAFMAGAGVLLAASGYLGGSLAHDTISLSAIEQRLRAAEQRSAPTIAERTRAVANRAFLDSFATLSPYPSQFTLFARVAEKLPPNGSRITAWSYQDGDLHFTVASPVPPDILFYVKTYSSVEGFTDVTADRADSDRSLRIKLRLARR
jgi:hypothetical protein